MKTMKSLVIALVLVLAGAVYAAGRLQDHTAHDGKAATKASCCATHKEDGKQSCAMKKGEGEGSCCAAHKSEAGHNADHSGGHASSCCGAGASCCKHAKEGSDRAAGAKSGEASAASCCASGAGCCGEGAECCAAHGATKTKTQVKTSGEGGDESHASSCACCNKA